MIERQSIRGFTLVETAMVILIISLLISGVLAGRDLIRAAAVRSFINQINSFDLAINTFYLKYNCLPGDCVRAVAFGLGTAGGPGDNGNGDRRLHVAMNHVENLNLWHHLSNAELISGYYRGFTGFSINDFEHGVSAPVSKINEENDILPVFRDVPVGVLDYGPLHYYMHAPRDNAFLSPVEENFMVDIKIDDGDPEVGIFIDGWCECCTAGAPLEREYDFDNLTPRCFAFIQMRNAF